MLYVLAFDRPIDMMPDIWPWSLRFNHTNTPTKSRMIKTSGRSVARRLELGVT